MKKAFITFILATSAWAATASPDPISDNDLKFESLHLSSTILTFVVCSAVILTFIKLILDYRLKNKLIEKGAPDHVVSQMLRPLDKDGKQTSVKWFAILMGLGAGLSLVDVFQPVGIHSLAIMSFSLAAAFLGYYFYIRRQGKS